VAAGFSVVSLGQETDGSLIAPASRAALFALKPTIGSVTMDNVIPVSSTFDTVGGMARSVLDLATLTEIVLDPPARAKIPEDGYLSYLTAKLGGTATWVLGPRDLETSRFAMRTK
jgi:amidase